MTGMSAFPIAGMVISPKPSLGENVVGGGAVVLPLPCGCSCCWNCCWILLLSADAALCASTFVHHSV